MKQVQISEGLFISLVKYHLLDMEVEDEEIKKELQNKMEALIKRELYSKYKTAPTDIEREKARQEYLDQRGIPESFRW